jgi:hypothetical protein
MEATRTRIGRKSLASCLSAPGPDEASDLLQRKTYYTSPFASPIITKGLAPALSVAVPENHILVP